MEQSNNGHYHYLEPSDRSSLLDVAAFPHKTALLTRQISFDTPSVWDTRRTPFHLTEPTDSETWPCLCVSLCVCLYSTRLLDRPSPPSSSFLLSIYLYYAFFKLGLSTISLKGFDEFFALSSVLRRTRSDRKRRVTHRIASHRIVFNAKLIFKSRCNLNGKRIIMNVECRILLRIFVGSCHVTIV